jgi:hypothetical protein
MNNSEDKLKIQAQELLDELRDTLTAFNHWKIPAKLKKLINQRLSELNEVSIEEVEEFDVVGFTDWFCQMYDVRKNVSKPTRIEFINKDLELFKTKTHEQWDRYFKEQKK